MKKYLITGCAGFIGSNFVHYMLKKYPEILLVNLDKLTYAGNLENLKAVLAGQAQIEDDEGKRRGLHGEQRGLSVTDPVDCVVLAFKEGNEAFTDHVIVFSDKNSHVFSLDIVDAGGRARSSARRPP